uniref:Uncharacterized protein n=1 Tax=Panagrolaimus superbus TaxID=310955 RepID=A0A914XY64_9BILA
MVFSVVYDGNSTNCGTDGRCPTGSLCVRPALFHEPHFCLGETYRLGAFAASPQKLYCSEIDEPPLSTAVWISLLWAALIVGFIIGQFLRLRSDSRESPRETPMRNLHSPEYESPYRAQEHYWSQTNSTR